MRLSDGTISENRFASSQCVLIIDEMVNERAPFRRKGYPRGGGYDRLIILCILRPANDNVEGFIWWLGPRSIIKQPIKLKRFPDFWYDDQGYEFPNALVVVGARNQRGEIKYNELNSFFASMEVGVFLQALHQKLCDVGLSNHIAGAIRQETVNQFIRFPPDVKTVLGLVC